MIPIRYVVMSISAFDGELNDPTPCASYSEAVEIAAAMRERRVKGQPLYRFVWIEPYTNQL